MSNNWKPTWEGEPGQNNGVRSMFTSTDIDHMKSSRVRAAIDTIYELDSYDNVTMNAVKIYGMVKNKRMPPGNPWPDEMLLNFKAWMDAGYPLR
jgi:hypothetical protein